MRNSMNVPMVVARLSLIQCQGNGTMPNFSTFPHRRRRCVWRPQSEKPQFFSVILTHLVRLPSVLNANTALIGTISDVDFLMQECQNNQYVFNPDGHIGTALPDNGGRLQGGQRRRHRPRRRGNSRWEAWRRRGGGVISIIIRFRG